MTFHIGSMNTLVVARPSALRIAAGGTLALVIAACTTGAPATKGPPASDICSGHVEAARDKLTAVIDANRACTSDADCSDVGLGAACFDSCSRPIATSGKAALEAAVAAVNAADCKAYQDDGCPAPISPPCAPPGPPACQEGKCI